MTLKNIWSKIIIFTIVVVKYIYILHYKTKVITYLYEFRTILQIEGVPNSNPKDFRRARELYLDIRITRPTTEDIPLFFAESNPSCRYFTENDKNYNENITLHKTSNI